MAIPVTHDNFVRAETDRYLASLVAEAGGINRWHHTREPASVDHQTIIRMNRDTLYSMAVVDISEGAVLTLPDAEDRYLSVMIVNQDHYINEVLHEAGPHELTVDRFDTPYVVAAARVLVDAADPADIAAAAAIQDGFGVEALVRSAVRARRFRPGVARRQCAPAARTSQGRLLDSKLMFGRREDVDPEQHLLGTAAGWGGLPQSEAIYGGEPPPSRWASIG